MRAGCLLIGLALAVAEEDRAWDVPAEACGLQARGYVGREWDGGFKLAVKVGLWHRGATFTVDFGDGHTVEILKSYAADVVSKTARGVILSLRKGFDENHGFGFTAKGSWKQPTISCTLGSASVGSFGSAKPSRRSVPPAPPSPPPQPSPPSLPPQPSPPSPPPYPPLTHKQLHPPGEEQCAGATLLLDKEWKGGFALTVSLPKWRVNLAVHLSLNTPAEATKAFHATLSPPASPSSSPSSTMVTVVTDVRNGDSSAGHRGAQVNFKGRYSGGSISCNSHCIGASVESEPGLGRLQVHPHVWRPNAELSVQFGEETQLVRVAHARVLMQSKRAVMVALDPRPDEEGAFTLVFNRAAPKHAFASCAAIKQPPSPPPPVPPPPAGPPPSAPTSAPAGSPPSPPPSPPARPPPSPPARPPAVAPPSSLSLSPPPSPLSTLSALSALSQPSALPHLPHPPHLPQPSQSAPLPSPSPPSPPPPPPPPPPVGPVALCPGAAYIAVSKVDPLWFQADIQVPDWIEGDTIVLDFAPEKGPKLEKVWFGSPLSQRGHQLAIRLGENGNRNRMRFRARGAAPVDEPTILCTVHVGVPSPPSSPPPPPPPPAPHQPPPTSWRSARSARARAARGSGKKMTLFCTLTLLMICGVMVTLKWSQAQAQGENLMGEGEWSRSSSAEQHKKCYIVDGRGREQLCSVSLEGVGSIEELREAVAEAASEMASGIDLPHLLDLWVKHESGRLTRLTQKTALRVVRRADSLRLKHVPCLQTSLDLE